MISINPTARACIFEIKRMEKKVLNISWLASRRKGYNEGGIF